MEIKDIINGFRERSSLARFNSEEKALELTMPSGITYDILLEDCADYKALLSWINHLARNHSTWFNTDMMLDLMKAWETATGLPTYGEPLNAKED